jgi:hypothetical protein
LNARDREAVSGFAPPYDIELLYEERPILDPDAILRSLRREMPIELITASITEPNREVLGKSGVDSSRFRTVGARRA